jgi:DNA-binding transcriptional LysR family regulator
MAGKHVSAIEADLNIRLMQRSTRQLVLTEAGQAYFARCKRILEEVEDANREASDTQQTVRGCVAPRSTRYVRRHAPEVIADYLDRHPGCRRLQGCRLWDHSTPAPADRTS